MNQQLRDVLNEWDALRIAIGRVSTATPRQMTEAVEKMDAQTKAFERALYALAIPGVAAASAQGEKE